MADGERDATPFLDRQLPLPQPPSSGTASIPAAIVVILAVAIAALSVNHSFHAPNAESFDDWLMKPDLGTRIVLLLLRIIGFYFLTVAVHELGHVLAGLSAGLRFQHMRVSLITIDRSKRLSLSRELNRVVNGEAKLRPPPTPTGDLRFPFAIMVAGGPAANLACAALFPFTVFGVISAIVGIGDLLPFETLLGVTDGKRLKMLFFDRARRERWLAIIRLYADSSDAAAPDKLSPELIASATAVLDESVDTVTAHALAYSAAVHQRAFENGGKVLEVCLRFSAFAPPRMRAALMSDAAIYQAAVRRAPKIASEWLNELPPKSAPWHRIRAEASILEANGSRDDAWKKLDEFEKKAGSREQHLLPLIGKWKSRLESAGAK
jgi:hypothetical protein